MKRANLENGASRSGAYNQGYRNRRLGYYRGKYQREVMTTLLVVAFIGMCLYRIAG